MYSKALFFTQLVLFISRLLYKQYRNPKGLFRRNFSNANLSQFKFQRQTSQLLAQRHDFSNQTLIFNVEGALLRSPSLFPYFMLVAFEAGSLIRAFLLFILYPFICLASQDVALKIMVMVCFFGVKKDSFRVGSAVLPKFFLEDVGEEMFEVLRRSGGKKVGVTSLPLVMVESFLRDYLEIDFVVGRDLKVFCGYFVGLMVVEKKNTGAHLKEMVDDENKSCSFIGSSSNLNTSVDHYYCFSHFKEIHLVAEAEKRNWHPLSSNRYPKPLIFHDGRLAFRPTPVAILVMFTWFPFGLTLAIIRGIVALALPYNVAIPILTFTGLQLKLSKPNSFDMSIKAQTNKPKGHLYVCNHRTLLDPLFLSFGLKKRFAAVTYSLSRISEILSPIRTIRLTRDRERDGKMMASLLSQGHLVVCPEGTTCREPFLLRFSPLFSELSDDIVPVAMDTRVSMFYGTTAGGLKCLDPVFFLMNPCPSYSVQILNKVRRASSTCNSSGGNGKSKFDVANHVQNEIGKALGFECTMLTRKDKYLILAGNEGVVAPSNNTSNR